MAFVGDGGHRRRLAGGGALTGATRRRVAFSAVAVCLWCGEAAAGWTERLDAHLPLAALVRPELASEAPEALRSYRRTLLRRLLLDEGQVAIAAPRDLHDAVLLATASALLTGAAGEAAADRLDAVRAAYVVSAAGRAVAERAGLREALAGLGATTASERTRGLFAALGQSAGGLSAVGTAWFPEALHAALADGAGDAELHHLRGLWLEHEGRGAEAADALLAAVKARPTVPAMVDQYRALVGAGRASDAATLAKALVPRAPGVAGTLAGVLEAAGDRAMTAVYEDPRYQPGVDERLAQALRYRRMGLMGKALATVEALQRAAPEDVRVRELSAEMWLESERFGRVYALCDAAEAQGALTRRLVEARVAAGATVPLAGGRDETVPARDVRGDLAQLRAMGGDEATARAVALVLALAAEPPSREAVEAAIREVAAADLERFATSRLVAAGWLALGQPEQAMWALAGRLATARGADWQALVALLAGLEVSYGTRRGDRALVARGVDRLEGAGEAPAVGLAALTAYHRIVGGRIVAWAADPGGRARPGAADEEALAGLSGLVDRLDVTVAAEREAARAAAVTSGALLAWKGEREQAIAAMSVARRIGPTDALGWLVAGQAAVIGGDAAGALTAFDEALAAGAGPRLGFAVHKWAALAANRSGDEAAMREHFRAMLALWEAAGAPEVQVGERPLALASGEAGLAVRLWPGEPLTVAVDVSPIVVLLPDFPHDRAEVRAVVGDAAGTGAP